MSPNTSSKTKKNPKKKILEQETKKKVSEKSKTEAKKTKSKPETAGEIESKKESSKNYLSIINKLHPLITPQVQVSSFQRSIRVLCDVFPFSQKITAAPTSPFSLAAASFARSATSRERSVLACWRAASRDEH